MFTFKTSWLLLLAIILCHADHHFSERISHPHINCLALISQKAGERCEKLKKEQPKLVTAKDKDQVVYSPQAIECFGLLKSGSCMLREACRICPYEHIYPFAVGLAKDVPGYCTIEQFRVRQGDFLEDFGAIIIACLMLAGIIAVCVFCCRGSGKKTEVVDAELEPEVLVLATTPRLKKKKAKRYRPVDSEEDIDLSEAIKALKRNRGRRPATY